MSNTSIQDYYPIYRDADNILYARWDSATAPHPDKVYNLQISSGTSTKLGLNSAGTTFEDADAFPVKDLVGFSSTRKSGWPDYDLYIAAEVGSPFGELSAANSTLGELGGTHSPYTYARKVKVQSPVGGATLNAGSSYTIQVRAYSDGGIWTGASPSVTLQGPVTQTVSDLRDDGTAGDSVAGDGIYSRTVTLPGNAGAYTVTASAQSVEPGVTRQVTSSSVNVSISTPPTGSVQLSSATYSVNENGGTVTITAARTGGSYGSASVNYATANGTAAAGSDYTSKSGTLNWSDGDSASKTFTVSITDDSTYEGNETFVVNLSGASGASLGTPSTATITINDNETPPPGSLQLSSATYSVTENGGTVTITATRTSGSYGAASVNYATANGTATAGSDYTSKSGTLNWSDGDSASKTFTVSITDDTAFDGDETFTVSLSGASGASLGAPSSATVTIVDNDTPARGTLQFNSATYSVAENDGSVTLSVTRQGGSYGAASVNYATANGAATAGSDYTTRSGTLNWADGESTTKTFSVPILDDSTYEGNETFTTTLSGAVGSSLGSPSTTTVTIQENEVQPDTQKPTVQITAPTTATSYNSPTNRLNIGGTASDNVGVTSVKARNFRDVGEYTCTGTTSWQYNGFPLFQGLNNISAISYDAAGNSQTDTVAVTYNGDTQYDDVLRSGGVVQEITFPDNLTPGATVTVRWKILSYVPVVARVYGGIPGGWYFFKNGTYTGYAESPWNLSGRHAGVYSFECSWPVPQKSGDFDVWFNMAQMDCDQFMIPVIPDGVDSRPDPSYAKLIQRTILAGGNGTDPTSDPDTWSSATVFETVDQHKKRSAAAVTSVTLADNLSQGAQVTCEWKILSYVPVKAQLLLLNLTQQQVWLTANATQVGSAVQTTYNFQDRTTGTRYYASEYTFRATFTVPNQPGTQQIFFRCQESANSSSSWMGANLSADIDSRPAQYNGMYGRFIERTINP